MTIGDRELLLTSILLLVKCLYQTNEHPQRPIYRPLGVLFLLIVLQEASVFDATVVGYDCRVHGHQM